MNKYKVQKLISKLGYKGAKRKMRMLGLDKDTVFRCTEFLFK